MAFYLYVLKLSPLPRLLSLEKNLSWPYLKKNGEYFYVDSTCLYCFQLFKTYKHHQLIKHVKYTVLKTNLKNEQFL